MLGSSTVVGRPCGSTVLKPVPGSGSRAKCAQFRGSSDAKHVSSWFQPWATLWPTCHMLVPASLLQSVECSTECKNSIFHCTIGCNKYKSSLASGASPQTPPGGLFLPPGPPPPAWVHAAHRHGMVSPRKVWFQRPCSSLVLVPEEVVEPASGRYGRRASSQTVRLPCSLHEVQDLPVSTQTRCTTSGRTQERLLEGEHEDTASSGRALYLSPHHLPMNGLQNYAQLPCSTVFFELTRTQWVPTKQVAVPPSMPSGSRAGDTAG